MAMKIEGRRSGQSGNENCQPLSRETREGNVSYRGQKNRQLECSGEVLSGGGE